jgi:hypothetical protein
MMVSPVAAANVPAVVMTAIAMPAVPVSMPVAALHLDDGIVLGRQRRYRQPRGGRANERQHRQSGGYCNASNMCHRNIPPARNCASHKAGKPAICSGQFTADLRSEAEFRRLRCFVERRDVVDGLAQGRPRRD